MSTQHENVLPAAVRRQIEQADRILEEIKTAALPAGDPAPADPAPAGDPAPADPAPAPADPPPTPAPAEDTAEHRFKVLQGKYNAEVPRLHRHLREVTGENAELKQRVNDLEATVAALHTREAPAPAAAPASPLTEEEVAQFGPDLIDIIRRVAKQETGVALDAQLKPVQKSVKHVQETVAASQKVVAQSARERMLAALSDAVPEWTQQNEDPKFLEWLTQQDAFSGRVRDELLADAYRKNDAPRLIAIFKGFQAENADRTSDQPDPAPTPPKPAEGSPNGLDQLVAPGTPKAGPTGAQTESGKMIWTRADIQRFTIEKNEHIRKFPERDLPEKLQKLDRDLFAAQHEGRIRF
jgi:hypothetical protein